MAVVVVVGVVAVVVVVDVRGSWATTVGVD
jgi:hypothetical protein